MTNDDFQLLYAYDRWANRRVLDAMASLSPEEFARDLGGSFASVRDTFVHIVAGEWVWLEYWRAADVTAEFLAELKTRRAAKFDSAKNWNFAEVKAAWEEVERTQADFLDGLTDEQLHKLVPVRKTQLQLAHLMQHLTNHSTYHRGQISLMMRQLKATPAATDFHEFLMHAAGTAAVR